MTNLRSAYELRHQLVLRDLATRLEQHVLDIFSDHPRIDRISARPKSIERFIGKANTLLGDDLKYDDPLEQIQDQIGVRIVVYYRQDVDEASVRAEQYFRYIESKDIEPEAVYEFSYFGKHYVALIPDDVLDPNWDRSLVPNVFELQIKTLFQHAWSEASHDIGYKPLLGELSKQDKRGLAFASAQAWGADNAFAEIFDRVAGLRL